MSLSLLVVLLALQLVDSFILLQKTVFRVRQSHDGSRYDAEASNIRMWDKQLMPPLFATTSRPSDPHILRQIDTWVCVKNCGACCKLGPLDSRPDLKEYLTTEEFVAYKGMIGEDDYCINFDKENRLCKIYDDRPDFCKISPNKIKTMFNVDEEDICDFCKFCCREQIEDVYGEDSLEMDNFEMITSSIEGAEEEKPFDPNEVDEDGGRWISIDIDPNDASCNKNDEEDG